jgi:hypothetical protein
MLIWNGACNLSQTAVLARNAMMYRGLTLLLAAVVLMASAADSSGSCAGHVRTPARGDGVGVTRFVCAHCTAAGQLSSRGLTCTFCIFIIKKVHTSIY